MREALRRHAGLLPAGFDLIFHPRRNVLTMEFAQLEAEIVRILEQAGTEASRTDYAARGRASGQENTRIMTRILLALIAFYRRWISPALHAVSSGRCKFIPTCSEYAEQAIATHGPLRGCGLAAWRLLRCHPFTPGGFDPVPPPSGPVPAAATRPVPPAPSGADCGCAPPDMPREPLP